MVRAKGLEPPTPWFEARYSEPSLLFYLRLVVATPLQMSRLIITEHNRVTQISHTIFSDSDNFSLSAPAKDGRADRRQPRNRYRSRTKSPPWARETQRHMKRSRSSGVRHTSR